MKKILAVLLAVICVFSAVSVTAFAAPEDVLGDIIASELEMTTEEDEGAFVEFGIYYEMATLSTVTLLYKPTHSLSFEYPTEMTVTNDTPVAVDHEWVCWKDKETGKLYYPGDTIEVKGRVTLVAVWEEKTDNYPGFIRSAIAGVQALIKVIEKFLGAFQAINNTKPLETTTAEVPTV